MTFTPTSSLNIFRPSAPGLLDTVGSSQVMIGSDYPFMFRDQSPEEEFDALGLTPKAREAVGSGNCLRFLRLT